MDAITGVLAAELGPRKIRVNSINPGAVETEGVRDQGFIGTDFMNGLIARPRWAASASRTTSPISRCSWPPTTPLADGREARGQRRPALT